MLRRVTLLIAVGAFAAGITFEPTYLEDAVGEYELTALKNLIFNTSEAMGEVAQRLNNSGLAKELGITAVNSSIHTLKDIVQDRFLVLEQSGDAVKEAIENGIEGTDTTLRKYMTDITNQLSEFKQYVKNNSQKLENSVHSMSRMISGSILVTDCQDLYNQGNNATGIYHIQKFGRQVLCDMEVDGGGWLVIQKRTKLPQQVEFNQDWYTYKKGFGELESEFWIGNEFLHVLTHQRPYQLAIDMKDFEKGAFCATYNWFRIGSERSQYALDIGDFTGNGTDAFTYHHGQRFTTLDRDNDLYSSGNCAESFTGGWWYDRCYDAHLNGMYPEPPDRQNASFITWWMHENDQKVPLVLNEVTLRIKPRDP